MTVIAITMGEISGLLSDPAHPFEVKDLDGNAYVMRITHGGSTLIDDDPRCGLVTMTRQDLRHVATGNTTVVPIVDSKTTPHADVRLITGPEYEAALDRSFAWFAEKGVPGPTRPTPADYRHLITPIEL